MNNNQGQPPAAGNMAPPVAQGAGQLQQANPGKDIRHWFNNGNLYPDLTIRLPNGVAVGVHRSVLCDGSEYFKELIEMNAQWPNNWPMMQRPGVHDHSEVFQCVLKKQYGFPLPDCRARPWTFWYQLMVLANKCRETDMGHRAWANFITLAREERNADVVVDILQAMGASSFATVLRRHHADSLLHNRRYRRMLQNDRNLMFDHQAAFANAAPPSYDPNV